MGLKGKALRNDPAKLAMGKRAKHLRQIKQITQKRNNAASSFFINGKKKITKGKKRKASVFRKLLSGCSSIESNE